MLETVGTKRVIRINIIMEPEKFQNLLDKGPEGTFPALHQLITQIDYAPMLASVMLDPDFPKDNVIVNLPAFKKDQALRISHQFTKAFIFNPSTREPIRDEGKSPDLAMFLNGLHYGRPLRKPGLLLFGLMTVGVMFPVIGPVLFPAYGHASWCS